MSSHDDIEALYQRLIEAWNQRDAEAMSSCFAIAGTMIGFDGSTAIGPQKIRDHLAPIFRDHPTATFVVKVVDRRLIAPEVGFLRAIAGMVPPGKADIEPAVNTIQTLVATCQQDTWLIELFQNTPAAFHGRPELQAGHTEALRVVLERERAT